MTGKIRAAQDPLDQNRRKRRGGEPQPEMRRLLSVDEAAAYLGISTWHVYNLITREEIPHVRIGKRKLIESEI
jgi:excisionase family DNA binding protein